MRHPEELSMHPLPSPELFFALVGPIGTDLGALVAMLSQELSAAGYDPVEVRMSQLLREVPDFGGRLDQADARSEDERVQAYMDCGDRLRERAATGAVLTYLAAVYVRQYREERPVPERARGRAFVFNSLKHPDEILALRKLYGSALMVVSMYSPRSLRCENLAKRIAKSRKGFVDEADRQQAQVLVDRDSSGPNKPYGQNVADTFPLADVFVRDGPREQVQDEIRRFVEVLFEHPYRTPTKDEFGMFQARAAALRSADLSRQVGAMITDDDGSLVASGCNEVPKAGGGAYWEGEPPDYRDFRLGSDANALSRREVLHQIFEQLQGAGWLGDRWANQSPEELVRAATTGDDAVLRDARVWSLLEFGRIVHAEMNALMDAARRGVSVRGGTLYCTTFPCHMCARHLLAAGIRRVVYIEPYPKSLAADLYPNVIRVDEEAADPDALDFDAFVGIAPRRFMECFHAPRRKDKLGYSLPWSPATGEGRFKVVMEGHRELETFVAAKLEKFAAKLGLT